MFTESSKPIVLRLTLYTLVIFSVTTSLPLIIQYGGITVFKENGPIEWLQFGLLVGASAIFLAGSFVVPVFRQLFLLLASVPAFGVVRELDALLDDMIPWIGWKIGHVIVLYAVGLAYVNRGILTNYAIHLFPRLYDAVGRICSGYTVFSIGWTCPFPPTLNVR